MKRTWISISHFVWVGVCVHARACVRAQSLSCVWLLVASLPTKFSRQEYRSGLPFPTPGDFPGPGSNAHLLHLLHWQADSLPLCHLGSPIACGTVAPNCSPGIWIGKYVNTGIVIQYMTGIHIQFMYMYGIRIQYMTYNFWSLLKFMSLELVILSSHLILCHPLFVLPFSLSQHQDVSTESVLKYTKLICGGNNSASRICAFHCM